jgi:hypothetical protein
MLAGLYHCMPPSWRSGSSSKASIMGLIRSGREDIDATAGGSFFTLSIEEAHKLVEKMASNQRWNEERTQTHTRKVHQLEEVDMLMMRLIFL